MRSKTLIEPVTDGTLRIQAIMEMAEGVQDKIVRAREGTISHSGLGVLLKTLRGEITFGGWIGKREEILGQGPCEEIGRLVCEAMGFTLKEGEEILSRLPELDDTIGLGRKGGTTTHLIL